MLAARFSRLVARQIPRGTAHAVASPLQASLLSTEAPRQARSSGYGSLAALALGGVAAGVAVQQLLLQPAAKPVLQEQRHSEPVQQQQQQQQQQQSAHGPAQTASPSSQHAAEDSSGAAAAAGVLEQDPVMRAYAADQQQRSKPADAASSQLPGPWVTDEEMEQVIRRRTLSKTRLLAYIGAMQQRVNQILEEAKMMGSRGEAWYNQRMKEMEEAVDLQAQIIIFGIDEPNARRRHLERYGCTKWTDEALDVIKQYSPLIEIGAGHGHWQRALEDKGADVVAFDNEASLPIQGLPNVGKVQKGDEKDVRKHRRRTLMLIYPGPDDMAINSLKEYKGTYLIYVGECRGGVNGTDEFFDALKKGWEVVKTAPCDPFPDGYEKLYVLKRKGGWWRWG